MSKKQIKTIHKQNKVINSLKLKLETKKRSYHIIYDRIRIQNDYGGGQVT